MCIELRSWKAARPSNRVGFDDMRLIRRRTLDEKKRSAVCSLFPRTRHTVITDFGWQLYYEQLSDTKRRLTSIAFTVTTSRIEHKGATHDHSDGTFCIDCLWSR